MAIDIPHILVVDDELKICQSCAKILTKKGYRVDYALNGYDALNMLKAAQIDIVITDLKMSRMGGMEVLRRIKQSFPEILVIVITGYSTVASAVEVMKMGAFDYLPKPFTPLELRAIVDQALDEIRQRRQGVGIIKDPTPTDITHQLIGNSTKIKKVIKMIQKVAPTDSTVLIYGESGTGKELVARAVHANSNRQDKAFFAIDCGTLSDKLLESELFGHQKGAFTGAHQHKLGLFKKANTGTIFLDEISNLNLEVQGKLLRFLETQTFFPLGSTKEQKVDIRLILATNRDLKQMVEEGTFRADFYYRIFVYPIFLPLLKERKTDILPIAYHFLRQYAVKMGKNMKGISEEACHYLVNYDWPGNVRQLRNAIERAVILCEGEIITPIELPHLGSRDAIDHLMAAVPSTNAEFKRVKKELRQKAVEQLERNFTLNALMQHGWNVTLAAQKVGMQRPNFQKLMKKYNIKRPKADTGSTLQD
jgi:DNA-binding NtrC family response regulator